MRQNCKHGKPRLQRCAASTIRSDPRETVPELTKYHVFSGEASPRQAFKVTSPGETNQ